MKGLKIMHNNTTNYSLNYTKKELISFITELKKNINSIPLTENRHDVTKLEYEIYLELIIADINSFLNPRKIEITEEDFSSVEDLPFNF